MREYAVAHKLSLSQTVHGTTYAVAVVAVHGAFGYGLVEPASFEYKAYFVQRSGHGKVPYLAHSQLYIRTAVCSLGGAAVLSTSDIRHSTFIIGTAFKEDDVRVCAFDDCVPVSPVGGTYGYINV